MKILLRFAILSVALSCFLYNTTKNTHGNSFDQFFSNAAAFIYLWLIFISYLIISRFVFKSKLKHKWIFEIVIAFACIILVYWASWRTCVYQKPPLTIEEQMNEQITQFNELNNFYKTIPALINKGEVFRPSEKTIEKDSVFILTTLLNLTANPPSKMDSLTELKVSSFFYFKGLPLKHNQDSLFFKNQLSNIHKTLKVRNFFYSPNFTKFLVFISYEKDKNKTIRLDFSGSGEAIVLMGFKKENRIIFFKYFKPDYSYGFITNENIAYSYCFKNAVGQGLNKNYSNFLGVNYWKTNRIKEKLNSNGKSDFKLEFDSPRGTHKFTIPEPILILDI